MDIDDKTYLIMGVIGLIIIIIGLIMNLIGTLEFAGRLIFLVGLIIMLLAVSAWFSVKNIKDVSKTKDLEKRIEVLEKKLKIK